MSDTGDVCVRIVCGICDRVNVIRYANGNSYCYGCHSLILAIDGMQAVLHNHSKLDGQFNC